MCQAYKIKNIPNCKFFSRILFVACSVEYIFWYFCAHLMHLLLLLFTLAEPAGLNELISVPEAKVTFGKPVDFPSYGWDNEYGQVTMKWVFNLRTYNYVIVTYVTPRTMPQGMVIQYFQFSVLHSLIECISLYTHWKSSLKQ